MKHYLLTLLVLFIAQLGASKAPAGKSELSFEVEVSGTGAPLLLIPGLTCHADVWDETVAQLSDRFECHAITVAGFAGSTASPELQTDFLHTLRSDLEAYISKLDQKPIVIGHSLGGFTAMNLAIHAPDKVEKIVVVDSYPSMGAVFFGESMDLEQAASMYAMQSKFMLDMADEEFEKVQRASLQAMIADSEKVEVALDWSLGSDRATTFRAFEELIRADLRDKMDQIQCPSLILQAGKGPDYSPERWEELNQNQYGPNPQIEIQRNMDSMHFIMFDTPEWMADQLASFL